MDRIALKIQKIKLDLVNAIFLQHENYTRFTEINQQASTLNEEAKKFQKNTTKLLPWYQRLWILLQTLWLRFKQLFHKKSVRRC